MINDELIRKINPYLVIKSQTCSPGTVRDGGETETAVKAWWCHGGDGDELMESEEDEASLDILDR